MAKDILIVPGSSNIHFSGSAVNDIKLETLDSGSVAFTSNSGSLFTITNSFTGSLFSVGDVSGVPILDVNSDDTVTLGQFSSPIKVLTNASSHTIISGSSTSTGSFGRLQATTIGGNSPLNIESPILTGNVGIGTTSPLSQLHAVGNWGSTYTGDVRVGGSSTSFGVEIKYDQSGATVGTIYSSPGYGNDNALLKIGVDSGGTNQLVLKGDGNVGIGSASPAMKLDVTGATKQQLYTAYYHSDHSTLAGYVGNANALSSEATNDLMIRAANDFHIGTNNSGTVRFTVLSGGNVGIGTTSPATNLHLHNASSYAHFQLSRPTDSTTVGYIGFKNNTGNNIASIEGFSHNATAGKLIMGVNATANAITVETSGNVTMPKNLTVGGSITAQEFITELNTVTIIESSGSTKFGNTKDDLHQFTGSVRIMDEAPASQHNGTTLYIGSGSQHYAQFINNGAAYSSTPAGRKTILRLVNNAIGLGQQYNNGLEFSPYGNKAYAGIYFYWIGDTSNGRMEFRTTTDSGANLATAMTITEDQKVGIGDTNPAYKLVVNAGNDLTAHFKNAGDRARLYLSDEDTEGFMIVQNSKFSIGQANSVSTNNITVLGDGKVGIGDSNPTEGKLVVAGTGASNSPALHLSITESSTFNHFVNAIDSNLTAGENGIIVFGQEADTKNSAYIGYKHRSDHGNDNQLTLGFWGANNLVNLLPNGNFGIGTETPGQKLEINGSGANLKVVSDDNVYLSLDSTQTNGDEWHIFNANSGATSTLQFKNIDQSKVVMLMDETGKVGIGNTSPSYALDVTGGASETVNMGTMRLDNGFTLTEGASNYANLGGWINVGNIGLYSGTNGAHIYPNQASDYGAWRMNGSKGGWGGITFEVGGVYNTLMSNSTTMGMYNDTDNEWMIEATRNGAVRLYYNATIRVETTSVGAKVVGNLRVDGGGNASDPLITTNSDTNTGIYFPGSGITGIGGTGGLVVENGASLGGGLNMNANTITLDTGETLLASGGYVIADGNAGFIMRENGSNRIILNSNTLRPDGNNSTLLGSSSQRWSNVYSVLGNFSGKLNVASSVGVGDFGLEKTFGIVFSNGVAHQKAQIQFTKFWGELEISIAATYSNQNAAGVVTKRFGLGVQTNATYANESRYTEVLGVTAENFAIGEATWDSSNSRYYIPIVHRVSTGNTAQIRVRCLGGDANMTDFIENLTVGSVYTSDTTAYDKPKVSFVDGDGLDIQAPLKVLGSSYNHLELESAAGNVGILFDVETSNTNYYDWRIDAQGLVANSLCFGHSTAAGNQTFNAANTVMTLNSSGQVGIGTTAPDNTLHVKSSGDLFMKYQSNSTSNGVQFRLFHGATHAATINSNTTNILSIYDGAYTGTNPAFNIKDGGKVGIGAATPEAIGLHIQKASTDTSIDLNDKGHYHLVLQNNDAASTNAGRHVGMMMQLNSNSAAAEGTIYTEFEEDGGAKLHFTTTKSGTGQERMVIDSDGNVGINDTTPSYKLDVNGTGRFTGKLNLDAAESLELSGIRGQAVGSQTSEFIQLYERVSIGNPSGWGHSSAGAPQYGLSVYGSVQVGRNGSGVLQMNGTTVIDASRNITNAGTYNGINISTLNSSAVKTTGAQTVAGVKTFSSNINAGSGQIVTPSSTNLALNPNTGIVSVGGVIQTTGTGNNTMAGNLVVGGNITAQQFITEYTTQTIIATSGSTKFGNTSDDEHIFTGSLEVTENIRFNGASKKLYTYHLNNANYIDAKNFQANTSSDINFQNAVGPANIVSVGNVVRLKSKGTTPLVASGSSVGIGTESPGNKLHIASALGNDDYSPTGDDYANAMLQLQNTSTSATTPHSLIHFRLDKNGGDGYLGFITDGSTGNVEHFVLGNQTDNEILRVASGGNVGIGTTTPVTKLHVNGNISGSTIYAEGAISAKSGNSQFGETDGTGNTSATFVVAATNTAGSPGIATRIRLVGYESRGIGVITKDTNSNHKFFAGVPYAGSNINYTIGYHPSSEDYAGYLSTHASAGGHGSIMVIDGPNKRAGFGAGWGGQGMSHTVDVSGSFRVRNPGNDYALLVDTSGHVGIGTDDPDGILLRAESSVNGNWAGLIKNTHTTNGYGLKVQGGDDASVVSFAVRDVSNNPLLQVLGDGKVGIGTTSPEYLLHLSGSGLEGTAVGESAHTGWMLRADDSNNRAFLILDDDSTDGVAAGADYFYLAQDDGVTIMDNTVSNSRFEFRTAGTNRLILEGNTLKMNNANSIISGSSTSTGSFGRVDLHQGLYFNREAAGNAIFEGRAHYQSPFVKFDAYNRGRIAFGADVSSQAFFLLDGEMTHTWTGAELYGVHINTKVWPNVSRDGVVLRVQGEIEKNSNAGVHNWFKGTDFRAPTVGNATATVTNTATVHIDGAMTVGTTNNYSLYNASTADSYFAGYIGIGASAVNPVYPLHIAQQMDNSLAAQIQNTEATDGRNFGLRLRGGSTSADYSLSVEDHDGANVLLRVRGDGNVGIGVTAPANLLQVGSHVHVTSAGLVGIGLAAPETDLHISNASPAVRFTDENVSNLKHQIIGGGDSGLEYSADFNNVAAGYHRWDISGAEKMRLIESGNLGIGITTPSHPLDVAGNARVSNNLYMSSYGLLSWDSATAEFRVYATSGNELKLSANGHNNHITVDTTGRVGINQTSPGAVLEVKGHSSVSTTALITHGLVQFKTTENDSSELRHQFNMGGAGDAGSYVIKQGDASTNGIVLAAGDDSYIAGNLGIGVASPSAKLHTYGNAIFGDPTATAHAKVQIQSNADNNYDAILQFDQETTMAWQLYNDASDSDKFKVGDNGGTVRMTVDQSGNVGIGTITPTGQNANGPILHLYGAAATSEPQLVLQQAGEPAMAIGTNANIDGGAAMMFYTNGSNNRMTIHEGGNIGIGTNAADVKLHLHHSSAGSVDTYTGVHFTIEATTNAGMQFLTGTNSDSRIWFGDASNNTAGGILYTHNATATAEHMELRVNAATRLKILGSGYVGIGTATPDSMLEVRLDETTTQSNVKANINYSAITIQGDYTNGAYLGALSWATADNTAGAPKANIYVSTTNNGSFMHFGTSNAYGSGVTNEAIVIDYSGNVGIGATPTSGLKLDVSGGHIALDSGYSLYFDGGSDTRMLESSANVLDTYVGNSHSLRLEADGDLQVKQDVVAYSSIYSDERLKDDVKTIDSALEKVKKLRGVEFVWNKGSRKDEKDIGVIAQETEKVLPEIVREKKMGLHTDSDEKFKTVDYDKLTAVLIESIKEQQKQIEELKSEIQELKDGSSK